MTCTLDKGALPHLSPNPLTVTCNPLTPLNAAASELLTAKS